MIAEEIKHSFAKQTLVELMCLIHSIGGAFAQRLCPCKSAADKV